MFCFSQIRKNTKFQGKLDNFIFCFIANGTDSEIQRKKGKAFFGKNLI
jgi:hypothetical protein